MKEEKEKIKELKKEDRELFSKWFNAKYEEFEQYNPKMLISLIELALQILHTKLDEADNK